MSFGRDIASGMANAAANALLILVAGSAVVGGVIGFAIAWWVK